MTKSYVNLILYNMKFKYLFLMLFFMLFFPLVFAIQESIIKTNINIMYNNETSTLRIIGEHLDWSKTIKYNESFNEDLEIEIIRTFGNYSEITELLSVCKEQFNFTDEYMSCRDTNLALDLKIRENYEGGGETINLLDGLIENYKGCLINITEIKNKCEGDKKDIENTKEVSINDLKRERDDAQKRSSWLTFFVFGLGVAVVILAIRAGFFRKIQTFEQRDRPRDMRY